MKDPTRERQAAEQAAFEQIGEQEVSTYLREDLRARIADLRQRLPRLFTARPPLGQAAASGSERMPDSDKGRR